MSYRLEVRPQVWNDIAVAANDTMLVRLEWASNWRGRYEDRIEDVQKQPLLARIRDRRRSVRWVFLRRFPQPHRVSSRRRCRAGRRRYSCGAA